MPTVNTPKGTAPTEGAPRHGSTRRWRGVVFGLVVLAVAVVGVFQGRTQALDGAREKVTTWVTTWVTDQLKHAGLVVRHVTFHGADYARQGLQAEAKLVEGQFILGVNLHQLRHNLEAVPWVAKAHVYRRLPHTLVVRIEEQQPFVHLRPTMARSAVVRTTMVRTDMVRTAPRRGEAIVDVQGRTIQGARVQNWQHLPKVNLAPSQTTGCGKSSALLQQTYGCGGHIKKLHALMEAYPAVKKRWVFARLLGARRWDLTLRHQHSGDLLLVKLPEKNTFKAVERLLALQKKFKVFESDLTILDLRFADRLIVRHATRPLAKTSWHGRKSPQGSF